LYFSKAENGDYKDITFSRTFQINDGDSNNVQKDGETSQYILSWNDIRVGGPDYVTKVVPSKSIGIVTNHDRSWKTYWHETPTITINKIEFYDTNSILLETIDFCNYSLNSSPFLVSNNSQDSATIIYRDEALVKKIAL
jgi:hypothetical protein